VRPARAFLLFVLVSLATRWLSLVLDVIDMDETAHIVGAWEGLRGRVPYAGFVNNKPPLLYVYYALSQAMIGEGLWSVRLLTVLATVPLTALALSSCFGHDRTGIVAGLTFLVYSAAFIGHDMLSVNTEILMLLPASWAITMVRDEARALTPSRALAAGALVATAALFRPQGVLFGPPLVLGAMWAARARRKTLSGLVSVVALGAGAALVIGSTWLAFARLGAADDLVYWVFTSNLAYAANPITAREALERGLSYLGPFVIVTFPLWLASWRAVRREGWTHRAVLGTSLVVCALPAALVGFRFYPHYFIQLYVPLAFLAAPVVAQWCALPLRASGLRFVAWSVVALVGFMLSTVVLYSGHAGVYREIDPVFARVGTRLRSDPCAEGGSLFVWGYAPVFYYHARMPAASRFVVLAQARLTGYVSGNLASVRGEQPVTGLAEPRHWDWLMDDLERRRATFILDTAPAGIFRWNHYPMSEYPRLQEYVDRHFTLVDVVDRVHIYRRNGCETGAGAP
jgi:4-amino-4-deoxy-L-arabinose transferase-like glycosyltransferase